MPKEAFMSDKELEDYRKDPQADLEPGSEQSSTNADQVNPVYTQPVTSGIQQSFNKGDDLKTMEPGIDALMWRDPPQGSPKTNT